MKEPELVAIVAAILRAGNAADSISDDVLEARAIIREARAQLAEQKETPPLSNLRTLRNPSP